MTTTLELFLTSYHDLFMPIWEYIYAPEQLNISLQFMEIIITKADDRSKKRTQIIKFYLHNIINNSILIDIGIDKLLSHELSFEGFTLLEQICLHNKYIPSIGCIMRHYLHSCHRGKLGLVELTFQFLYYNYIRIIHDNNTRELAHWLLLQYGRNMSEYLNVIKFVDMTVLTKPFHFKKYSFELLCRLINEHLDFITITFLDHNIEDKFIDPINLSFCLIHKKMYQLIIPSFELSIHHINHDITQLPLTTDVHILKQFLEFCKMNTHHSSLFLRNELSNHTQIASDLETIYKYLRLTINDDFMMWLITGFALNIDGITKYNQIAHQFLLNTRKNIEHNGVLMYESIEQINIYIKFFRLILDNSEIINRPVFWSCKFCTFDNTHTFARLCQICFSNRFN